MRFASDDGTLKDDSNLADWSCKITEASANYNRPIPVHADYMAMLEKAGFVDVRQVILKCPTNPWPKDKHLKDIGKFQLLAHLEGLEGVSMGLLTRGLEWKPDEVKVLIAKLRGELKDRNIHSYQPHVVVVGRKPRTPQTPDSATGRERQDYQWTGNAAAGSVISNESLSAETPEPADAPGDDDDQD